jgi:hypothetical protein
MSKATKRTRCSRPCHQGQSKPAISPALSDEQLRQARAMTAGGEPKAGGRPHAAHRTHHALAE